METNNPKREITFLVLLALVVGVIGANIGHALYYYDTLAKGIIGSTVLYLIYVSYINPKHAQSRPGGLDIKTLRENKFQFLLASFTAALVGYLSITYVYDAVLYLLSYV
jgi:hypothetical protein